MRFIALSLLVLWMLTIAGCENKAAKVKKLQDQYNAETSRKPIPLDTELAEVLLNWKLQCPYPQLGDWVFASPKTKGKQPYWPGALFRKRCSELISSRPSRPRRFQAT